MRTKNKESCIVCNALFEVKKCHFVSGSKRTCSKKCSNHIKSIHNYKYNKKEVSCQNCTKIFLVKPSRVNGTKFCSRECMREASKKETWITLNCKKCNVEFKTYKNKPLQHCTSACAGREKLPRETRNCVLCKNDFIVKSSSEARFCSRKCSQESQKMPYSNPERLQIIKDELQKGITQAEIAFQIGIDDTTVCHLVNKYSLDKNSKYNRFKSWQEKAVGVFLEQALNEKIEGSGKYDNGHLYDFKTSLGYIEYDGRGGHYRPDQIIKDNKVNQFGTSEGLKITRLSPQAFFGEVPYLKWILLNQKEGYCNVKSPEEYSVLLPKDQNDQSKARLLLANCHPLEAGRGAITLLLKHNDHLIGAARFGPPTDKNETGIELTRFFVLDGTPKNTESWFLSKCLPIIKAYGHTKIITYCHEWESGSYLKATGWQEIERKHQQYDYYLWNGKTFSKRVWWNWAKTLGLVEELGSSAAKKALALLLGAEVIYEGTKLKFVKNL